MEHHPPRLHYSTEADRDPLAFLDEPGAALATRAMQAAEERNRRFVRSACVVGLCLIMSAILLAMGLLMALNTVESHQ